jgi:hypothetical protein
MRLFLALVFLSSSVFGATWIELEAGKTYRLNQSFQLPQNERSKGQQDFSKGQAFPLRELIPLSIPGALLLLYIFDYPNCPGPELSTDMEIIPVSGTNPLVEVGAQVEECSLSMYIEMKDQRSKSLFE